MSTLAARAVVVTATAALVLGAAGAPAFAAPLDVTLQPTYGPVGATEHITAASGLSKVDEVTFGSSSPAPVTSATDTEVVVVVPGDATTGAVTLGYSDLTPDTQTDESFTVQVPTAASVSRSRSAVVFPGTATISATLRAAGVAVPGQDARLQRKVATSTTWSTVQHVQTTNSHGYVSWTVHPRATTHYRVRFQATPDYLGTVTSPVTVRVQPRVAFTAPDVAPILTRTRLHGRVRPTPAAHSPVLLDQRIDGTWKRVDRAHTNRHGRFAFHVTFDAVDHFVYRARRPHDAGHLTGISALQRVQTVNRTLRSGMSGWDVRMLQHRLKQLHYDVGQVNGSFGFDTAHAVVAFEKVQGMKRDGVVGAKAWRRLGDPRRPRLQHPGDAAGAGVEVDLTHQVLLYAVDGKVRRIFDASTGGGYYYTGQDGSTQRAITPTGHFSVQYKRDGWVHAPLGELYRPAYFNNEGYAIHGETEVPSYPASHGCVRITVPAMDRFNGKLYVGLSVWIYS